MGGTRYPLRSFLELLIGGGSEFSLQPSLLCSFLSLGPVEGGTPLPTRGFGQDWLEVLRFACGTLSAIVGTDGAFAAYPRGTPGPVPRASRVAAPKAHRGRVPPLRQTGRRCATFMETNEVVTTTSLLGSFYALDVEFFRLYVRMRGGFHASPRRHPAIS